MNSFNHYAYGSIGAWLYSVVAGIELDPACPAYKHVILRPRPGGGLTQAAGKLETLYGELVSEWTLVDGTFEWTVVVPPNTTATVHLPVKEASEITLNGQAVSGSVHEVEAGEYRFVVS
jgi:alpha-L-rhamnosidase